MKDIIIRQATLNDLKSIQKLNYELFKLEKENYDPTLIGDWPLLEEGKSYFENLIGYLAGTINEKGSYNCFNMERLTIC